MEYNPEIINEKTPTEHKNLPSPPEKVSSNGVTQ